MPTITVLHVFSGDLWAGAEVMVFNLLREFARFQDAKVIAISLNDGILTNKLRNAGVETYVVSEKNNSLPAIGFKCLKLLKGKDIDIIHSHRYKENVIALWLAKVKHIKCLVSTMHGLPEKSLSTASVSLISKINYYILKHFFTRVVSVSDEIKNILLKKHRYNQSKVCVIYNGIFIQSENLNDENHTHADYQIGTVGRMVEVKNYSLFLDVAASILKDKKNVKFSILGDGPLKEKLIQKRKQLGLENNVTFCPPVENPLTYYQSLDIYLSTSLHEGIPLSILEAMSCKLPVVAPRIGGIPEIITDKENGQLIENYDVDKYTESCVNLLDKKELRIFLGDNALKTIKMKFSVEKMAESYWQFYKECAVKI